MTSHFFLILTLTLGLLSEGAQQSLCSNEAGAFIGLAVDSHSYLSVPGSDYISDDHGGGWHPVSEGRQWPGGGGEERGGERGGEFHHDGPQHMNVHHHSHHHPHEYQGCQKWELVQEVGGDDNFNRIDRPKNSFTGQYLQVLPDIGRVYPGTGHEHHNLEKIESLQGVAPYISFMLDVSKTQSGWHTLFLRWTAGDAFGSGDSLYVVMMKGNEVVSGQRTVKPAVRPIMDNTFGSPFKGCCMSWENHSCECKREEDPIEEGACMHFLDTEWATGRGIQCPLGPGIMDFVEAPKWYLYAGQEVGSSEDFDAEPWDVTCEAEGHNSKDSGSDNPTWYLEKGTYELRIYAREDGTAFDGFYLAGPHAATPDIFKRYGANDSTVCPQPSSFLTPTLLMTCLVLGVIGVAIYIIYCRGDHKKMFDQAKWVLPSSLGSYVLLSGRGPPRRMMRAADTVSLQLNETTYDVRNSGQHRQSVAPLYEAPSPSDGHELY